jgi:benzoyl-CoA reductase/2-hydroxyglutaryl-CoA dehydratase subunit BcrC/BadD/HgdB
MNIPIMTPEIEAIQAQIDANVLKNRNEAFNKNHDSVEKFANGEISKEELDESCAALNKASKAYARAIKAALKGGQK